MKTANQRRTPTEEYLHRQKNRRRLVLLAIVALLVLYVVVKYGRGGPITYQSDVEHFKYGSIGSDIENGMPIAILKVLPKVFPEYLPEGEKSPRDLTAFGFIQEPGHELPIGFSQRKRIIMLTGLNCGACHVGVVRDDPLVPGMPVVGMPANTVNLQAFFVFLFDCASDERFNGDVIVAALRERQRWLNPLDAIIYRQAIPQFRAALLLRQSQIGALFNANHPDFGPGRVDTFNPYKLIQFADYYRGRLLKPEEAIGTSDFPSIWNQAIRRDLNLHWDGNNKSVRERNVSAAFGAGATRENIDLDAIVRIENWLLDHQPTRPQFLQVDTAARERGENVYRRKCYACHDVSGDRIGSVEPLAKIGTSEWRLNSFTDELAKLQRMYGEGFESWTMESFTKTNGYANAPLDGLWARAPYLHNGSVPTIWELLTPAAERSTEPFYRGHGVLDVENLGIRRDVKRAGGLPSFLFDVGLKGNGNQGHSGEAYGTELSDQEKRDLIEYLKTL